MEFDEEHYEDDLHDGPQALNGYSDALPHSTLDDDPHGNHSPSGHPGLPDDAALYDHTVPMSLPVDTPPGGEVDGSGQADPNRSVIPGGYPFDTGSLRLDEPGEEDDYVVKGEAVDDLDHVGRDWHDTQPLTSQAWNTSVPNNPAHSYPTPLPQEQVPVGHGEASQWGDGTVVDHPVVDPAQADQTGWDQDVEEEDAGEQDWYDPGPDELSHDDGFHEDPEWQEPHPEWEDDGSESGQWQDDVVPVQSGVDVQPDADEWEQDPEQTRPVPAAWSQPAPHTGELPESTRAQSQVDNANHLLLPEDEPPGDGGEQPGMAKRLAMGTFWQVISQFAPLMIGLLMTPIIIAGMGKPRYSIFLLINGLSLVMSQFDGGIGQSALRFFTLNAAAGDKRANTRLLTTLVVLSTLLMTLVFGTLALNADKVLTYFKVQPFYRPEAYLLLVVMMIGTGAIVVRNLFNSVLFANHRFVTTAVATVMGQVVYALGMVWTLHGDHGLYGVAATFIVQQIVGTGITLPVSFQYLDRRGVRFMHWSELKDFFKYSWKVQLAGLIAMLMQQKDQLAAGRILGGQSSGPYSQGTTFATQLRMMPLNAMGPMQAMIGHLVSENGPQVAKERVEVIQRFWIKAATGWFTIGIPAAYVGVQRWLPDSFAVTGTVAALLLLGYLFASWSVVLMLWCLILGHSELDARYGMVALFSNLVLSAVAWFPFGIKGVVAATAVSWLIAVIFLQWDAARTLPVRIKSFWSDIPFLAALVAGGGTMALELYLEPQLPRHIVGLFSAALVALPGVVVFALLAFSPAQLKQGLGMVRAKLGR